MFFFFTITEIWEFPLVYLLGILQFSRPTKLPITYVRYIYWECATLTLALCICWERAVMSTPINYSSLVYLMELPKATRPLNSVYFLAMLHTDNPPVFLALCINLSTLLGWKCSNLPGHLKYPLSLCICWECFNFQRSPKLLYLCMLRH